MITWFLATSFGKTIFQNWHWLRWVLIAVLLLVIGITLVKCFKPKAKLNEVEIQRGEQAIKEGNDKELNEIITNSVITEKIADEVVAVSDERYEQIKKETEAEWKNANREQLQAEFDRRK